MILYKIKKSHIFVNHHRNNDLQKHVKSKSYRKYFLTILYFWNFVKGNIIISENISENRGTSM